MKEKSDEGGEEEGSGGKQERCAFDEGHPENVGADEKEQEDNAGEEEESELDLRNYLRDDILESVRERG